MRILGEIGPGAASAVPALLAVLRNENADPTLRLNAVEALSKIGAATPDVVDALFNIGEKDKDRLVSGSARSALKLIRDHTNKASKVGVKK